MNMKGNTSLLYILLISLGFLVCFVLGVFAGEKDTSVEHIEEVKGYHYRYLQLNPFTGDKSYADFDSIFGHQDDEFYPWANQMSFSIRIDKYMDSVRRAEIMTFEVAVITDSTSEVSNGEWKDTIPSKDIADYIIHESAHNPD